MMAEPAFDNATIVSFFGTKEQEQRIISILTTYRIIMHVANKSCWTPSFLFSKNRTQLKNLHLNSMLGLYKKTVRRTAV